MLSSINRKNIENFNILKPNHQRVFRYYLRRKCEKSLKDLQYLLINKEKLKLKKDDIVNPVDLMELQETYENT